MHNEMMEISVRGTFAGHALPGAMFVVWSLYWLIQSLARPAGPPLRPIESGLVAPLTKVGLAAVGIWIEIPNQAWSPVGEAVMMNWQHVTMYAAFGLSGVVDLLAIRRLLSPHATYFAFAAAALNSGFLFWGHGNHGGVPGAVHTLLVLLFGAVALAAVVEAGRPSRGVRRARIGATLALGSWFVIAAWILYVSDWDLASPIREGWAYMVFSWNALAVATLVVAVDLLLGRGTREVGAPPSPPSADANA